MFAASTQKCSLSFYKWSPVHCDGSKLMQSLQRDVLDQQKAERYRLKDSVEELSETAQRLRQEWEQVKMMCEDQLAQGLWQSVLLDVITIVFRTVEGSATRTTANRI